MYQPTAMVFFVFLALELFVPRTDASANKLRIVACHLAAAIGSAVIAFGIFRALTAVYGSVSAARSGLTDDPLGKLTWFVNDVLVRAGNLLVLTGPHLWLTLLVGTLAVLGVAAGMDRPFSPRSAIVGVTAVLLVPLAYAPNLAVEESWSAFRTQGALKMLIGLYVVLGAAAIWRLMSERIRSPRFRAVPAVVSSLVLLAASIGAFRNVTLLFAQPQITELRVLKSQLAAIPDSRLGKLIFIQPQWWEGATDTIVYDEFGFPSTAQPWVPEAMIYLLLEDEDRLPPNLTVSLVQPDDVPASPMRAVIDMRALVRFR